MVNVLKSVTQALNSFVLGQREALSGHKVGYCATGACGVVSWNIVGTMNRLSVMYSCPYNFDFFSNRLGVGIYTCEDEPKQKLFNRMYYGKKMPYFQRRKFRNKLTPISLEVSDYQIYATMGSSHKPEIKIWLFPKNTRDLAANVNV